MSLYQMVNGLNPATFYILPMLGNHPDMYPRFRDCFLTERKFQMQDGMPLMLPVEGGREDLIFILTRTGGNNRADYQEQIDWMRSLPGYIEDYDEEFDSTFAFFVYEIPEKWKPELVSLNDETTEKLTFSDEYVDEIQRVYPKLADQFELLRRKK